MLYVKCLFVRIVHTHSHRFIIFIKLLHSSTSVIIIILIRVLEELIFIVDIEVMRVYNDCRGIVCLALASSLFLVQFFLLYSLFVLEVV